MTRELRVLPAADSDIDECFYYYEERSGLETAFRFVDAIQESFERLLQMPHIGSPREFRLSRLRNIRMWTVKGFEDYLIFYRPTDDGITVLRVLHGRRDIEEIFNDE
ncbi:MAG: type II toxin-antitoxin system RelE/ParE family toxin [Pyrinomonadaceae bacterium MAG19_C2-C3]|nr:type II toxin-antitoxin system RelE/ParE family toxin [Pyrinomonadaceae bacterium MAG19_C2-C3]